MIDLFKIIVSESKLNDNFKKILYNKGYEAARLMITEVFNLFPTVDEDFVQQFQTTGFDARIWELNLMAAFDEVKFKIPRTYNRPDFELEKKGKKIFVEAVTTNSNLNELTTRQPDLVMNDYNETEWANYVRSEILESTIKIASALTSKLSKKYWDLHWVKGYPFILAVEPFHHSLVHFFSDSNISGYLYGMENSWTRDNSGKLIITTHRILDHPKKNGGSVPSHFFGLPGAENISAVMFSNGATVSKFLRMGKLKGLGKEATTVIRKGFFYSHDPNATEPIPFEYNVGVTGPQENWAQGLFMYHNPFAKYPVEESDFPDMLHGYFDGDFQAFFPDFFPVSSETKIYIS